MGRQWGLLQPLPHRPPRTPPPNLSFLSAPAAAVTLKINFLSQGVFFFSPVLHILQVHENRTFQLSSSTEKWSEVFLSEGIFLSDELSLQPRSPYQCGSDAGPSLVRVRRALQPQLGAASTTSEGSTHHRSRELTARILTFLLGLLRELQGRDAQSKCRALGTPSCCYHPDWLPS